MSEVDLSIRLLMLPDGRAVCICYTTTGGCGGGRGGSVALQLLGFALVNSVVTAQMASLKNVRKAFLLSPVS